METRDKHRTTTTITTAARFLGVSVETLRKRLQRGSVEGFKAEDGSWRVVLDMSGSDLAALAERDTQPGLDELMDEVRTIRGQVTALAEALCDLTALLQQLDERSALAAGGADDGPAPELPGLSDAQVRQLLMALLDYLQAHQHRQE